MIERRDFLKLMSWTVLVNMHQNPLFANSIFEHMEGCCCLECSKTSPILEQLEENVTNAHEHGIKKVDLSKPDLFLHEKYHENFYSVLDKLNLVQAYVGFGNYNVISFDEVVNIARIAKNIKKFTPQELEFMEYIFYTNPNEHGFYGEKTCESLTQRIDKNNLYKVPYSGHFLFKDRNLEAYNRMVKDVGDNVILTSGVRSVMKQMKLFLEKVRKTDLNLSEASISIAPPAYSFHSLSDFDVGKKGFGYDNFTEKFVTTEVFQKMIKLNYVDIRYTVDNLDGVRYEPWHVKVI